LFNRHWRTFSAVEVRLGLLVEFLTAFLVEVISAFNEDCALVGFRLALVEFISRLGRDDG
jgi:hypothetical protein